MKTSFLYKFSSVLSLLALPLTTSNIWAQRLVNVNDIKPIQINESGYFFDRIPIKGAYSIPQVTIENVQMELVNALPSAVQTSPEPTVDVTLGTERKQTVAAVRVPLYIAKDGQYYIIKSFDLKIDGESNIDPNQIQKRSYVANSVLQTGTWKKISIAERGIYKIDYNQLQSMGFNPSAINPNNIRIFGHGGTVLSEKVVDTDPDDLIENAIQVVSASGNSFQQGDYILFYANGPVKWEKDSLNAGFKHVQNIYEDKSYYFITVDNGVGKRIESLTGTTAGSQIFTDYNAYAVLEQDTANIGNIGKRWYGHGMLPGATVSQSINLGNIVGSVKIDAELAAKTEIYSSNFTVSVNDQSIVNVNIPGVHSNSYVIYNQGSGSAVFTPNSGNLTIKTKMTTSTTGKGYIDYYRFNYKKPLSLENGWITFRNWEAAQLSGTSYAGYTLSNANANTKVWDISNPTNPILINGNLSGSNYNFSRQAGELREFVAFDGSVVKTPTFVGNVENQNLHALPTADYLIITHPSFANAAQELADFHRNLDGKSVHVVTTDKIYNEFSSGSQDISAIRNFIRMIYEKGNTSNNTVKNVLFLGASSFDYKDRIADNTNFVPSFETDASSNTERAYTSDEFFALLDVGEDFTGNNAGAYIDIGVGRIPAISETEVTQAIQKIKRYHAKESFGEWKNSFTFVTDDYDGLNFLESAEGVGAYVEQAHPNFTLSKIYTDALPKVVTASGTKYPAATQYINNQIYNGTLVMNYIGHGSPERWATEEILTENEIATWSNANKLPIFVTGTCDFGRYDNPKEHSAGVKILMKPDGGAIGLITTTQLVYANSNDRLNEAYTAAQFTQQADGSYMTLGEALSKAKNNIVTSGSSQENAKKFVILGDPAIRPAIPNLKVETATIVEIDNNGNEIPTTTLKALGRYKIKGTIKNPSNNVASDFNGELAITVYDKAKTLTATNQSMINANVRNQYKLQNSVLFKGKTTVNNGEFETNIIIPKDINYDLGTGKISYYAYSDTKDAIGLDTTVQVGDFSQYAPADNDAPIVKVFIDNNKFQSGGIVSESPLLYAEISDDNGINVSGSSVGHDLIAVLDENSQDAYILNSFYTTLPNEYSKGTVSYQLNKLSSGFHTIKVRAWDIYNNSGTGETSFYVVKSDSADMIIYNYPNPFYDATKIVVQHNQPNVNMDITFKVFNSTGQVVHEEVRKEKPSGSYTEFEWDGTSVDGATLSKGVYFYKIDITTEKGLSKTLNSKLVLLK